MNPLLLTLLVGFFILGGTLLGFCTKNNKKIINLSIGIAFGVMIALMILELIPEAYENLKVNASWRAIVILITTALIGVLIMNILDNFVPHHEHESHHKHTHKDDTCHNEHLSHIGILATIALVIHNIIEGMTLFVTATSSMSAGYLLCVGIGLHNIPLGLLIAGTLRTKKQTVITSLLLTLSTFVGGIIMHFIAPMISEFVVGLFIALTLGMLIYIVFIELLGQMIHSENKKITIIGALLGIALFGISVLLG